MRDIILFIFVVISLVFIGVLFADYTRVDLSKDEVGIEKQVNMERLGQYKKFSWQIIPYTPLPKPFFKQEEFGTDVSQKISEKFDDTSSSPVSTTYPPQVGPQSTSQGVSPLLPTTETPAPSTSTEEEPPTSTEEEPPPPFFEEPIDTLNNILDKLNLFISDMNSGDDDFYDPQDE